MLGELTLYIELENVFPGCQLLKVFQRHILKRAAIDLSRLDCRQNVIIVFIEQPLHLIILLFISDIYCLSFRVLHKYGSDKVRVLISKHLYVVFEGGPWCEMLL